mmetsp:Transcript_90966/g.283013  ORF Transcript_90966/g.283013 Transcript_90966/m.283013 type:complete len:214 (+) Transcript_90966:680-1321(+)
MAQPSAARSPSGALSDGITRATGTASARAAEGSKSTTPPSQPGRQRASSSKRAPSCDLPAMPPRVSAFKNNDDFRVPNGEALRHTAQPSAAESRSMLSCEGNGSPGRGNAVSLSPRETCKIATPRLPTAGGSHDNPPGVGRATGTGESQLVCTGTPWAACKRPKASSAAGTGTHAARAAWHARMPRTSPLLCPLPWKITKSSAVGTRATSTAA